MDEEGTPLFTIGVDANGEPWVKAEPATNSIKDPATYSAALGLLVGDMQTKLNLHNDKALRAFVTLALQQTAGEAPTPATKATAEVRLSGQNLRSGRRATHDIILTDIVEVAGNEDVVYITLKNTVLGIILNDAYQAAKVAMGKRDFKYFLDEANLSFALSAHPADLQAMHDIFDYADQHDLLTNLVPADVLDQDIPASPAEYDDFLQSQLPNRPSQDAGHTGNTDNIVPFRPKN